jgi:hypothetical protein
MPRAKLDALRKLISSAERGLVGRANKFGPVSEALGERRRRLACAARPAEDV